jgi:hypothetical protein
VPVAEIEQWDTAHDAVGRPLTRTNESGSDHHGDGEKVGVVARTGDLEK